MAGLLGNLTNTLDQTLTGGDGNGGLVGGVTKVLSSTVNSAGQTVQKVVDSAGNIVEQTLDDAGNVVSSTTKGVADTAGGATGGKKGGLLG